MKSLFFHDNGRPGPCSCYIKYGKNLKVTVWSRFCVQQSYSAVLYSSVVISKQNQKKTHFLFLWLYSVIFLWLHMIQTSVCECMHACAHCISKIRFSDESTHDNCISDNGTTVGFWLYSFCCGLLMITSEANSFKEIYLGIPHTLSTYISKKKTKSKKKKNYYLQKKKKKRSLIFCLFVYFVFLTVYYCFQCYIKAFWGVLFFRHLYLYICNMRFTDNET